MSTRATYLFSNTSMAGEDVCIYIHHDGYPSGAAQYLSRAKHLSSRDKRPLLESFIAANKGAEITRCHSTHGDTDYRYSITSTGYGLADVTCHSRHLSLEDDEGFSTHWKEIFSGSLNRFIMNNIDAAEALA
jgi:hypothetical protein